MARRVINQSPGRARRQTSSLNSKHLVTSSCGTRAGGFPPIWQQAWHPEHLFISWMVLNLWYKVNLEIAVVKGPWQMEYEQIQPFNWAHYVLHHSIGFNRALSHSNKA